MKFKMQNKENQLIERISVKHLVIGAPLTFKNNEEGFASFLKWIKHLQRLNNLNEAIVGMEPTGHYWINLSKCLFKQNIEVGTVNPHLVKKNTESHDNTQSKSDKKDTLVIADMVKILLRS